MTLAPEAALITGLLAAYDQACGYTDLLWRDLRPHPST